MKKIFIISTFILAALVIFNFWGRQNLVTQRDDKWETFNKVTQSEVTNYPTTKEEAKKANIDLKKLKSENSAPPLRKPAAVKKGRELLTYPNQKLPKKLNYKNAPREDWKALFGQDVLRFLRPDTLLHVKKEKSATIIEEGKGRYVEQVLVKLISPEGRKYSYQAFVDSENGKVIKTWNQTIHEPFGKKAQRMRATGSHGADGVNQF